MKPHTIRVEVDIEVDIAGVHTEAEARRWAEGAVACLLLTSEISSLFKGVVSTEVIA